MLGSGSLRFADNEAAGLAWLLRILHPGDELRVSGVSSPVPKGEGPGAPTFPPSFSPSFVGGDGNWIGESAGVGFRLRIQSGNCQPRCAAVQSDSISTVPRVPV